MKESQQNLIFLVRSMFVAGQERVKSLESRAERENTKSEIRLVDLSDKLQDDFTPFPIVDGEIPGDLKPTDISSNGMKYEGIEQSISTEATSIKVSSQPNVSSSRDLRVGSSLTKHSLWRIALKKTLLPMPSSVFRKNYHALL